MMKEERITISGCIGISGKLALAETAARLSDVLGGVQMSEDPSGRYEEFPAFVGEVLGLRFALLGNPDPENELREDPGGNYELHITTLNKRNALSKIVDISAFIVELLNDGDLPCWLLE